MVPTTNRQIPEFLVRDPGEACWWPGPVYYRLIIGEEVREGTLLQLVKFVHTFHAGSFLDYLRYPNVRLEEVL